jgi:hypothetical protein
MTSMYVPDTAKAHGSGGFVAVHRVRIPTRGNNPCVSPSLEPQKVNLFPLICPVSFRACFRGSGQTTEKRWNSEFPPGSDIVNDSAVH